MARLLSLTLPDGTTVTAPSVIPQGGLTPGGKGESALHNSILLFLIIVVILSLFFLIWGGIQWITSQGDKSKLEHARKTIIYAIVGLMLAFLSFAIVNLVGGFFGIHLLGS